MAVKTFCDKCGKEAEYREEWRWGKVTLKSSAIVRYISAEEPTVKETVFEFQFCASCYTGVLNSFVEVTKK